MESKQDHENEQSSDNEVVVGKPPSNTKLFLTLIRLNLKPAVNFILDGFPPVVAVIALILAVMAMNDSRSSQAQLSKAVAKLDSISTSMQLASKSEMDKIKAAMAKDKLIYAEDLKQRDMQIEQMAQVIHSVSRMQKKLKISPTLEEQMRQPVAVSAVAPATAKELTLSKVAAPALAASAAKAPAPAAKVQAPAASTGSEKKLSPQVQSIKEAIEEFNKK